MLENDNLVIGASKSDFPVGIHTVEIRREENESYVITNIHIVRVATQEEYVEYHKQNGITYKLLSDDKYFAFYMD